MAKQKTTSSSKRRAAARTTKKATAARRTAPSPRKRAGRASAKAAGDEPITIDRRQGGERRSAEAAGAAPTQQLERRKKVTRRRQIDPTTCERDYTEQEIEFMNALDDYKRRSGRMFPTCSEVLEVIHSLGYVKLSAAELAGLPEGGISLGSAKPMPGEQNDPSDSMAASVEGGEPPADDRLLD